MTPVEGLEVRETPGLDAILAALAKMGGSAWAVAAGAWSAGLGGSVLVEVFRFFGKGRFLGSEGGAGELEGGVRSGVPGASLAFCCMRVETRGGWFDCYGKLAAG